MPSGLHLRVLFARLSSLIHRSPPENDAADELQQPSTPSRVDLHAVLARLSSLLPRIRLNADEEPSYHPTTPSGLRPDALIDRLSSLFRLQHPIPMKKLNSRSTKGIPMLSKWLQCGTGRHCMLLRGRDLIHTFSLMVLHLHSHDPSHGGFMSCFSFAVRLLSTPMATRNQHNNSNINHKAQLSPRHHHRRLSLLPPRRPWHLLLLLLL
ncbi:hypothetical protein DFJ58DRAFT_749343, partial [Suillus subalutaceus]|uniref:uncharacterized protein n=1 Tax=Suillus subalutaceus TaxID=48586 RepID=UPI001B867EAF